MTSSYTSKMNKRNIYFTHEEEMQLVELVVKYQQIVECKKTDSISNVEKKRIWERLSNEFNSQFVTAHRTGETLKNKYNNIKKRVKKKLGDEKSDVMKTGGGAPLNGKMNSVDLAVLRIIGFQATGYSSVIDSDAILQQNDEFQREAFETMQTNDNEEGNSIDDSLSGNLNLISSQCKEMDQSAYFYNVGRSGQLITTDLRTPIPGKTSNICLLKDTDIDEESEDFRYTGRLSGPEMQKPNGGKNLNRKVKNDSYILGDINEESADPRESESASIKTTNDWSTYTPQMLRKKKSVALQSKNRRTTKISETINSWVSQRTQLAHGQSVVIAEENKFRREKQKWERELAQLSKDELLLKMKYMEETHEIIKKERQEIHELEKEERLLRIDILRKENMLKTK